MLSGSRGAAWLTVAMAVSALGALHVVVVREPMEEILVLMEGSPARDPIEERLGAGSDFVSDGNGG